MRRGRQRSTLGQKRAPRNTVPDQRERSREDEVVSASICVYVCMESGNKSQAGWPTACTAIDAQQAEARRARFAPAGGQQAGD